MKLMIVEGNDELNFFTALLNHMSITDVKIENSKGKDRFKEYIKATLMRPEYADQVTVLAVVGDADNDANAAFTKISNLINELGYTPPQRKNQFKLSGEIKSGIYIMPGDYDAGMLEDLCISVAKDKAKLVLARKFVDDAMALPDPPGIEAKSRAMAYLSIMPVSVPSVGVAAIKGYWDFDCPEITDLRAFLENLR